VGRQRQSNNRSVIHKTPWQRDRVSLRVFETLEHGGEYPDTMPQAIRVTDAEGRSCIYVPITVDGKVVDSKGFSLEPAAADPAEDLRGFA